MNKKSTHRVIPSRSFGMTRNLLAYWKIPAYLPCRQAGAGMTLVMLILFSLNVFAQAAQEVEMADEMRSSGKIYVVVTVLCILFAGIVVYLVSLDRKISKLEKNSNQNKS